MSYSRNKNNYSFDDTRKTYSCCSNQDVSDNPPNKSALKENIAKIDCELLELRKKIYQLESRPVLVTTKKIPLPQYYYENNINKKNNYDNVDNYQSHYTFRKCKPADTNKNYLFSKFSFEILRLSNNFDKKYQLKEDILVEDKINILVRTISEKESIINNLMNDLILLEGKLKNSEKENEELKSKLTNEFNGKNTIIDQLRVENEKLCTENKNLKVDNVTLYNMCTEKDQIINQKLQTPIQKETTKVNDLEIDQLNDLPQVANHTYDNSSINKYNCEYTRFTYQEPKKSNSQLDQLNDNYDHVQFESNLYHDAFRASSKKYSDKIPGTDQQHTREPMILHRVEPFRAINDNDGLEQDNLNEENEVHYYEENPASFRGQVKGEIYQRSYAKGKPNDDQIKTISNNCYCNSNKERTRKLLFPSGNLNEEDNDTVNDESPVKNTFTKSSYLNTKPQTEAFRNSSLPSATNTQPEVSSKNIDNEQVNQLVYQINELNTELKNQKREIAKTKEEMEKLEEENRKLRCSQRRTYSESRQSELSITNNEKEQDNNNPEHNLNINHEGSSISYSAVTKKPNKSSWLSKMQFNPQVKETIDYSFSNEKNIKGDHLIFTVYDKKRLLSFDFESKKFGLVEFADFSNFDENFILKGSAFLNTKNYFYVITGDNYDMFYRFSYSLKSMTKLSKLNNNHSFGGLLYLEKNNEILSLSGAYNKIVEKYNIKKNYWTNLENTMTIERIECSYIIVNNHLIFAFFGFNCPQTKYVQSIEYCDIDNNYQWRLVDYVGNIDNISLELKSHFIFGYGQGEFILVGGYDGRDKKAIDTYLEIEIEEQDEVGFCVSINSIEKKIFDFDKNKSYSFFGGEKGIVGGKNESYITCFDTKNNLHCFNQDTLAHEVYYFE